MDFFSGYTMHLEIISLVTEQQGIFFFVFLRGYGGENTGSYELLLGDECRVMGVKAVYIECPSNALHSLT